MLSRTLKIGILGSTGMIGHAMAHHFMALQASRKFKIILSCRDRCLPGLEQNSVKIEAEDFQKLPIEFLNCDYIINCIGKIKQLNCSNDSFYKINSDFPQKLATECYKNNIKLIHISTDCVFSGQKGSYIETDIADCNDIYGLSKLKGESDNCMIIRSSFIGQEIRGNLSLLEWAKSKTGQVVNGYVNHYWSGLTNKEFSKVVEKIIVDELYRNKIVHIFSNTKTKYEMLCSINRRFDLNLIIKPTLHETNIYRTLNTIYNLNRNLNIKSFDEMILEI